ncbi:MAG: DUF998 domain-containing protein, partial [Halobacteriales archaeon]|nr:DUF998 domain-containing protein [Halobacteriales archaeon]
VLARVGFFAVVLFVAALLTLHAANLPEEPEHMSGFVHTSLAPLWIVSLCAFALGGVALTLELRRHLATHPCRSTGIALLWLSAAGALILAACPVDADPYNRTTLGLIHEDTAPPTFLLAAAAMLVLSPAFHAAHGWRRIAGLSFACGFLAMGFALAYVAATLAGDVMAGVVQRLLVASIVAWMLIVAIRLLQRRPEPAARRRKAKARPTCAV